MERQKRKADIEKGLQFIQSTLPLKQEEYEAFLLKLVQNLFAEGNDLFREKDYKQALVQYMEGLNVADYAASDQVALPRELLCKLHVNRAACYFTMGLYEKALEDSEKALGLDGESIRALFRKARALNELGRHKEAYECSSRCSLALPHDENVTQLGQELAQKLGLRVRKAYKRPQELETFSLLSNGAPAGLTELDTLLDSLSLVQGGLPGSGMPSELPQLIPVFPGGTPLLPPVVGGSIPVSSPLPPASFGLVMDPSRKLAASVLDALDSPGPTLDPLDLLPYSEARLGALDSFGSARGSLDKPDSFLEETSSQDHRPPSSTQKPVPSPEPSMPNTTLLIKNPLAATHEFKQACQLCYPRSGHSTGQEALPSLKYSHEMELGALYWSLTTWGLSFLICERGKG